MYADYSHIKTCFYKGKPHQEDTIVLKCFYQTKGHSILLKNIIRRKNPTDQPKHSDSARLQHILPSIWVTEKIK